MLVNIHFSCVGTSNYKDQLTDTYFAWLFGIMLDELGLSINAVMAGDFNSIFVVVITDIRAVQIGSQNMICVVYHVPLDTNCIAQYQNLSLNHTSCIDHFCV